MKTTKLAIIMSLILGIFATASFAQSVQSDFDKSFDFSKLKTFNFTIQNRGPKDPLAQDQLNNGRIKGALQSNLAANGFRSEDDTTPSFEIAYYVTTKNKLDLREYNYGPPRWFGSRSISVDQYTEGTLVVDFIDPATKQLIWRGRASGTIELKGVDKKINKSVEKLIKQFVKDSKKKG